MHQEGNITIFGQHDEGTLEQIRRAASNEHVKSAVLCADGHLGYAVPIGGVVAYRDAISPSGVGFDISCIAEDSLITLADGCSIPIQSNAMLPLIGSDDGILVDVGSSAGRKISSRETVAITVSSGDRLLLTADHELLTPTGWKSVQDIPIGSHIAVSSIIGIDSNDNIGIEAATYMRLLGYVMGDGNLSAKHHRISVWTSKDEDVASILDAFAILGVRASVYRRVRSNGTIENNIYANDITLYNKMTDGGCPHGKKLWNRSDIEHILNLPIGHQVAWLSGLFSAEMTTPWCLNTRLCNPAFKQGGYAPLELLNVMSLCLAGLGFETSIAKSGKPRNHRQNQAYVLQVLGGQGEFVRLWRMIGFCFCAEKRRESARMMSIAWQRDAEIKRMQHRRDVIKSIRASGEPIHNVHEVASMALGSTITKSIAFKAIYCDRGKPRTTKRFTAYTDKEIIWVTLDQIGHSREKIVHDIQLTHDCHNFVANGIVVHNCGNCAILTDADVSAVRTNISKIRELYS